METSTIQRIKQKASRLFEDRLLHPARVLEVRHWDDAAMTEIDLHLPDAKISEWADVPYIKFKTGTFTYRDYSPFGWDAATQTCSLLIHTDHEGAGSNWAKQLQIGDAVQYLKIDSTKQAPHPTELVVGLGDASSLGHLLALQQLTLPNSRFDGAVLLDSPQTGQLFRDYFSSPLTPLANLDELSVWLNEQGYCQAHTWFYLTGNNQLVGRLRKFLKGLGHQHILVKGFWE